MRAELEKQRHALEDQRQALEAQTKALHRAMKPLDAAAARKLPPDAVPDPKARKVELEIELRDLIKKALGQPGKKDEAIKVIVIRGDQPNPAPHPDLGRRLDHVQRALVEALQEIRNLRRDMGQGHGQAWPTPQPATSGNFAPPAFAPAPTQGNYPLPSVKPPQPAYPATPAVPAPPAVNTVPANPAAPASPAPVPRSEAPSQRGY
jgi:hypothetical protein